MHGDRYYVIGPTIYGVYQVWDRTTGSNAYWDNDDVLVDYPRQGTARLVADDLNARAVTS